MSRITDRLDMAGTTVSDQENVGHMAVITTTPNATAFINQYLEEGKSAADAALLTMQTFWPESKVKGLLWVPQDMRVYAIDVNLKTGSFERQLPLETSYRGYLCSTSSDHEVSAMLIHQISQMDEGIFKNVHSIDHYSSESDSKEIIIAIDKQGEMIVLCSLLNQKIIPFMLDRGGKPWVIGVFLGDAVRMGIKFIEQLIDQDKTPENFMLDDLNNVENQLNQNEILAIYIDSQNQSRVVRAPTRIDA